MTDTAPQATGATEGWLELAVEVDHEAVEPVTELFARYGYNEGVVIHEPFTQDPDGDNMKVDPSRPVTVSTFVAERDVSPETLDEIRRALWHLGRMRLVGELTVTHREEENWVNAWKEHYHPLRIGNRVTVCPPWHDYAGADDEVVVVLDPGMAFGTGMHPSTKLAVLGLEAELRPGVRVLDVGTGSGVLAIAAVLLGAFAVDAVDIEPVAVRSTAENATRNGVADRITAAVGSVGPDAPFAGSYALVLANIIARVLIDLAAPLAAAVAPGGSLVLSGIIESREPAVRRAFEAEGLIFKERDQIEDWVGLVYHRPSA
ncbi:MAG: Ribosomal protein L11 methyltransferase [uncultured Thermomicrobiales bacterium]|uniref:Ribosomal protein L11 methyltransferase n=1 Tax=uncultured Thermomicrobiales bacterium TaxID=1645740 RepID=A0A6J4ULG1_9BACT|nr:MAG: Ribosomal protein L11 methyltransferase [uncultured Thermomicrobiales bacterium]